MWQERLFQQRSQGLESKYSEPLASSKLSKPTVDEQVRASSAASLRPLIQPTSPSAPNHYVKDDMSPTPKSPSLLPSLSPTTLGREATLAGSLRAHRGISTKYFLRLFCHVLLRTTFSGVVWGQLRQILRASVPWMRSVLILERTCADEVGVGRVEARLNALAADLNTACSRCCPRVSFVIARGRMTIIVPPQMQLRHGV